MKYELTENTKTFYGKTLYQIRALVTIAAIGVQVGDLGGYIERESCLSHDGNAWVSGDAKVSGNAKVYGDAWVYGNAWVSCDAKVSGNAWVSGDAKVSGNAKVYGDAWVYGNAWVSCDAKVSGNAQVSGDAKVSGNAQVYGNAKVSGNAWVSGNANKTPVLISGLRWHVTIIDTEIKIGCQFHKIEKWSEFTDDEIKAMDSGALEFWIANKEIIMTLANNHKVK